MSKDALTGASNAGQAVVNTSRKAEQGIAAGTKKTGDLAGEAGHNVAAGAETATDAVMSAGRRVGEGLASGTAKAGKSLTEGTDSARQGLVSAAGKVGGIFKRKRAEEAKEADIEVDSEGKEE
jgi:hypothetical protein